MSNYTKTLLFALVVSCAFIFSCGKKSAVNCGNNFISELQNETNGLTDALTAYSTDDSVENCEKYKDALRKYFNAFEGLRGCYGVGSQKAAFDQAVKDAKKELDDWEC